MELVSTKYDLEPRTLTFAKNVKGFVKALPKSISNYEYSKQLIRSSGSVGANYIEANESLGNKDFIMHIRISCKEAKETIYWLELIDCTDDNSRKMLIQECSELIKIFGSILRNKR